MVYDPLKDYFEETQGYGGDSEMFDQMLQAMMSQQEEPEPELPSLPRGRMREEEPPARMPEEAPARRGPIDYGYLQADADLYKRLLSNAAPGVSDFIENAPENFKRGIDRLGSGGRSTDRSAFFDPAARSTPTTNMYGMPDPDARPRDMYSMPMTDVKPGASDAERNKAAVALFKSMTQAGEEAAKHKEVVRHNLAQGLLEKLRAQSSPGTRSFVVVGDKGGKKDISLSSPDDDTNKGSYSKDVNRAGAYDKATMMEKGLPKAMAELVDAVETTKGTDAATQFLIQMTAPKESLEERLFKIRAGAKDATGLDKLMDLILMRQGGYTKEQLDAIRKKPEE